MTKRGRGQRRNRRLKNRSAPIRWIFTHQTREEFAFWHTVHRHLTKLLACAMGVA